MTDLINTSRLTLRTPRSEDAVLVPPLIGDLDVARWLTHVPHPYGLDDARDFISGDMSNGAYFIWYGDTLIGCVSIRQELGYWLARKAWGQGFAAEAARALVAHHFEQSVQDLESGYFVENSRSRNVLLKLGFVESATRQAKCRATGDWHVLQRMLLTRTGWEDRT